MKIFYTLLLSIAFISIHSNLSANCHYRGGYIGFEEAADLKFDIRIITFTFENSSIDRDSLKLNLGDGTSKWAQRTTVQVIGENIQRNIYTTTHTYPGQGDYQLSMTDSLKCGDNFSNNTNTLFCLYNDLKVLDAWFHAYNNSPILKNYPIDTGCIGQVFEFNPNTIDLDNDSLAYRLSVPFCTQNYSFPNIISGGNTTFAINPQNGLITWDNPTITGDYAVSFIIEEHRNGVLISESNFEFTIPVTTCTVNTKEIDNDLSQQIELFPNPTSGFTNLKFTFEKPKDVQIQVLNSIGQVIESQDLGEVMNDNKYLYFDNYLSGFYFLKVVADNQPFTKTIIVN
jgi:hypothetical protein